MGAFGRVLIVDDEAGIRDILSEYLTEMNFEVETAVNGKDALNRFSTTHFDMVLSDLIMPELDGMELLKRIKQRDEEVIFIMITGYPTIQTAVEAIKSGAYDYITKPFHVEDVRLRINRAFENKALQERLKNIRGIMWALLLSIPIWMVLGIILARLIR